MTGWRKENVNRAACYVTLHPWILIRLHTPQEREREGERYTCLLTSAVRSLFPFYQVSIRNEKTDSFITDVYNQTAIDDSFSIILQRSEEGIPGEQQEKERKKRQLSCIDLILVNQCDRWIKQTSGIDIKSWCTVAIKKTNLSCLDCLLAGQSKESRFVDDRYLPIPCTHTHTHTDKYIHLVNVTTVSEWMRSARGIDEERNQCEQLASEKKYLSEVNIKATVATGTQQHWKRSLAFVCWLWSMKTFFCLSLSLLIAVSQK